MSRVNIITRSNALVQNLKSWFDEYGHFQYPPIAPKTPRQKMFLVMPFPTHRSRESLELVQSHAHRHICVLHHLHELFEADLSISVEVCFHDGLVDDLGTNISTAVLFTSTLSPATLDTHTCCNC